MTSTLILTTLLVFSFAVGRFIRKFQTPNFIFSGMIYVIMGLLVGSHLGFGILSDELLLKLEPLTSLLIGIAGYLLGLRFKNLIRHRRVVVTGMLSGGMIFAFIGIGFTLAAWYLLPKETSIIEFFPVTAFGGTWSPLLEINQLWFCLGISATACSASLLNLGSATRLDESTSEITKVLQILTKTLQCMAIVFIGACLATARATAFADSLHISVFEWSLACIFSGIVCGFLFSLFIGRQSNKDRVLLAALGTIIFACGLGHILGVSSLFVAFFTGATISLFSKYRENIQENLVRLEEPIFVLLLVISGASWKPELNNLLWALPLIYFSIRFVTLSLVVAPFYSKISGRYLARLGQGLLGQDLMAVAVALSFATQFPEIAQLFLTTILGSIFLNDILASSLLKKVILDNEQTTHFESISEPEEAS